MSRYKLSPDAREIRTTEVAVKTLDERLQVLGVALQQLSSRGVRLPPLTLNLLDELSNQLKDLDRQRDELASLYAIAQDLAAATELGDLLESIIDKALILVGGERGFVVLGSSAEQFHIAAARRFSEGDVEPADGEYSSSLVRRVLETREPILTTNVQDDVRYELTQSILIQNIRSVLAVPMLVRGELQGAIYVDTRLNLRPFGDAHLRLLQAMANQAAMAIRNAKLHEDIKRRNEELERALRELRETQSQLVQAERLAAVGSLAANVAHELRNPLMVMRNATYFIDRLVGDGKLESPEIIKRYAAKIDSEIDRQTKIINDLLFFSRNRPRKLAAVDLNAILEETLMRVQMPESIAIVKQLDATLEPVQGDADQLQQVFVNLVTNAVQAMPNGGTLTVRTSSEQGVAQAIVQDTGVGMSPEHLARLFEPFFSTKQKGIGLGLAVTRSIVEAHRGRISVCSQEGQGTTFTVQLCHELVG